MPYALFSDAEQVSQPFASKAEVWHHAATSGLVVELGSHEEDPPRRILDMGYAIRECAPKRPETGAKTPGMSELAIAELIATCRSNQPSEAAAS